MILTVLPILSKEKDHGIIGIYCTTSMTIIPTLNALAVIFLIPSYRKYTMKRLIGNNSEISETQLSTVQQQSSH